MFTAVISPCRMMHLYTTSAGLRARIDYFYISTSRTFDSLSSRVDMNTRNISCLNKSPEGGEDAAISGSRKRRARTAVCMADETSKRKRLASAMEQLNLGTPPAVPLEWGSPFGTKTRLRKTSPRRRREKSSGEAKDSLGFGASFKRALGELEEDPDTDNREVSPTKRRRDNNSRALVLYRGAPSSPRDLIRSALSGASPLSDIDNIWTALPRSVVPKVIIEPPDDDKDGEEALSGTNQVASGTVKRRSSLLHRHPLRWSREGRRL